MPTIHRERGFRFVIYLNDHEPPHVHAWRAGVVAKVQIGDAECAPGVLDPGAMRVSDVRRAVRIVEAHQEEFLAGWRKIHGT